MLTIFFLDFIVFVITVRDRSDLLLQTTNRLLGNDTYDQHNVKKCMLYFYTKILYMGLGTNSSCKQT